MRTTRSVSAHRDTCVSQAAALRIVAGYGAHVALYAAYGSNLDPDQMRERCPHSPVQSVGWLRGWRLTFGGEDVGWDGALATVVQDPDAQTYVMLYDVSPLDEKVLDEWEGAGLARRDLRQAAGARLDAGRRRARLDLRAGRLRGRAALVPLPRPDRRGRREGRRAGRLRRRAPRPRRAAAAARRTDC